MTIIGGDELLDRDRGNFMETQDGITSEERNSAGGPGCVSDGWVCFDCGDCTKPKNDSRTQDDSRTEENTMVLIHNTS